MRLKRLERQRFKSFLHRKILLTRLQDIINEWEVSKAQLQNERSKFDFAGCEHGRREERIARFPQLRATIEPFARQT